MPGKINNGVSIGAVGARKKKVSKRQPKQGLRSYAKAVGKYLVLDTYMYAPLVEEAAVNGDRCSTSSSLSPDHGIARSPLNTEALRKISAKLSAKRSLYEEFVEHSHL